MNNIEQKTKEQITQQILSKPDSEFKCLDKSIVLFPGSFKPPHKGHWQIVLKYLDIADEIHIFISATSQKFLSNKSISKSNLSSIFSVFNKFLKKKDKFSESIDITQIYQIISDITENYQTYSYTQIQNKLKQLITLFSENEQLKQFEQLLSNKLALLKANQFKSIRYTANGKDIDPEIAKSIFEIYINEYNLANKVFVHIAYNSSSPFNESLHFANFQCKNCDIYAGSNTEEESAQRAKAWETMKKAFEINPTNRIHLLPTVPRFHGASATQVRNNINNLSKSMFPDNISNEAFEQIKKLLLESKQIKSKFNIIYQSILSKFR